MTRFDVAQKVAGAQKAKGSRDWTNPAGTSCRWAAFSEKRLQCCCLFVPVLIRERGRGGATDRPVTPPLWCSELDADWSDRNYQSRDCFGSGFSFTLLTDVGQPHRLCSYQRRKNKTGDVLFLFQLRTSKHLTAPPPKPPAASQSVDVLGRIRTSQMFSRQAVAASRKSTSLALPSPHVAVALAPSSSYATLPTFQLLTMLLQSESERTSETE